MSAPCLAYPPPDPLGSPRLVHEEPEWRRPAVLMADPGFTGRIIASRWTNAGPQGCTVRAEITGAYHTVAVALRPTKAAFRVSDRLVHEGRLAADTVQVSGPAESTAASFAAACDMLHLHVANDVLDRRREEADGCAKDGIDLGGLSFARDPVVGQLGRTLLEADAAGGPFAVLLADALEVTIVTRLLGRSLRSDRFAASRVAALPKWRLRRACDFVEANLDQPIRLADLADAAGLSPMHFAAQFRSATGERPHAYLLRRRVEGAQRLMATSATPLAEVALAVGFQTQAHFTTVFKGIVGTTPAKWRASVEPPRIHHCRAGEEREAAHDNAGVHGRLEHGTPAPDRRGGALRLTVPPQRRVTEARVAAVETLRQPWTACPRPMVGRGAGEPHLVHAARQSSRSTPAFGRAAS